MNQQEILDIIQAERRYQDNKWGGREHDIQHTTEEWASYMFKYLSRYIQSNGQDQIEALIKLVALGVAVLELHD